MTLSDLGKYSRTQNVVSAIAKLLVDSIRHTHKVWLWSCRVSC